jgi:hypothetical protein
MKDPADDVRGLVLDPKTVLVMLEPSGTGLHNPGACLSREVDRSFPCFPPPMAFHQRFFMSTREDDKRLDERQSIGPIREVFSFGLQGNDRDPEVLKRKKELKRWPDLISTETIERFDDEDGTSRDPPHATRFKESA